MRHFHLSKNKYFNPIVNLDKLWTLVGEEVRGNGFWSGREQRHSFWGWCMCRGRLLAVWSSSTQGESQVMR